MTTPPPGPLPLTAVVLNCTLKPSPASSSTDKLSRDLAAALDEHAVTSEVVRVVDHAVRFGVSLDEGDGDEWPQLRSKVVAADILVVATPIWMGQPSSVCKMVMERLDAELGETDDEGRPSMFGKVAGVAVVGNEDGAHKITADLFQALNDIGCSVPAQGGTYWNGEAMGGVDYNDLDSTPEAVARVNAAVARNAAHLARALRDHPYPAYE